MIRKRTHHQRPLLRNLARSRLVFIVVSISVVAIGVSVTREALRRRSVSTEVDKLKQEIATLEKDNESLGSLIQYLQSPLFKEQEARIKLGLQKRGEQVIAMPNDNANRETVLADDSGESDSTNRERGNPAKWMDYLFGRFVDRNSGKT